MKWNAAFKIAEQYYTEHGDLLVPKGFISNGFNLYSWISRQRRRYSMSLNQVSIAGNGENISEQATQTGQRTETIRSTQIDQLGQTNQVERTSQTEKAKKRETTEKPLTENQIALLNSIGMVWNLNDYSWERAYAVAESYFREHGNLSVPKHYEQDGVNLSHWIWAQRRIVNGTTGEKGRKLTEEQIHRLESIGMEWDETVKRGGGSGQGKCES